MFAAASFATLSTLVKLAYIEGAAVLTVLAVRYSLAAVAYTPIALFRVNRTVIRGRYGSWVAMSVLYSLSVGTFYLAIKVASVSEVAPIVYLYPAMVILLERFAYRETLGVRAVVGVTMGLVGSILVLGIGLQRPATLLGGMLALISAVANALQYVVAAHKVHHDDQLATASAMVLVSAIAFTSIGVIVGLPVPSFHSGILILLASAIGAILPYAFLQGLSRVGASRAVMMSALEPALIVLLALVVLRESIGLVQAIGISLILTGFVVASTWLTRDDSASHDREHGSASLPKPNI
jgi:drug/metabolite transporter (DMT)-like permease